MRTSFTLLVLCCGCNDDGAGAAPALSDSLAAGLGVELESGCRCAPDRRAAAPTYDCEATALPAGAALCQRGQGTIYCAPDDQRLQTFTGEVACDPGFCVSFDGESCVVLCECRR